MLHYVLKNILQVLTKNRYSWLLNMLGIIIAIVVAMNIGLWIHESLLLKK